jgi:RNA polymerase sigma-70 factor (ECF subfamily)
MTLQPSKQQEPLATIAKLRAFAVLLCMDVDLADDLVHITLLRTGVAMSSFEQGGDASAWLFGKLRSYFYSEYASRSAPNLGANADGWPTNQVHVAGPAHGALLAALAKLSPEQREALVLVEAAGFCHSEAARICRCRPDTVQGPRRSRAHQGLPDPVDQSFDETHDRSGGLVLLAGGAGR